MTEPCPFCGLVVEVDVVKDSNGVVWFVCQRIPACGHRWRVR